MVSSRYAAVLIGILFIVAAAIVSANLYGTGNFAPVDVEKERDGGGEDNNALAAPETRRTVVKAIPSRTGIYFPLFAPPGPLWDNMLTHRNAHPSLPWIAIVDPHHGPGAQYDANYAENINKLQAANVTVLGYVSTLWAARPPELVKADIDRYKEWYNVDGIMLDEMISDPGFEGMYSGFADHAKSKGMSIVIGNVGTNISPSYASTVDAISTVEGDRTPPLSWLKGWQSNYDKSNFVYITYSQSWIDKEYVAESAKHVGSLYITDDTMPFPYDNFPTFLDEVLEMLDPQGNNDLRTLSVRTSDLRGEDLDGILVTASSPSLEEGDNNSGISTALLSTPLAYVGKVNSVYAINAASNSTHVFDHWEDGSTNPVRKVMLDSSKVLRAYYRTASTIDLKSAIIVESLTVQGGKLGMWINIHDDDKGVEAGSGFAPQIAKGQSNATYSVTANDHQHLVFDHWEDGSTNRTRTVHLPESSNDGDQNNAYLTAFYRVEKDPALVDLTVNSYTLDGTEVRGLWSIITPLNQNPVGGGTPLTHLATSGQTYTVQALDSGIYTFDHWKDGSTNRTRTVVMPGSDVTLSAYYTTPPAKLNVTLAGLSGERLEDNNSKWNIAVVRAMDSSLVPVVLRQDADSYNTSYKGRLDSVYSVQAPDLGGYTFDHWENGSRDRLRNVMLSPGDIAIIAYYKIK